MLLISPLFQVDAHLFVDLPDEPPRDGGELRILIFQLIGIGKGKIHPFSLPVHGEVDVVGQNKGKVGIQPAWQARPHRV